MTPMTPMSTRATFNATFNDRDDNNYDNYNTVDGDGLDTEENMDRDYEDIESIAAHRASPIPSPRQSHYQPPPPLPPPPPSPPVLESLEISVMESSSKLSEKEKKKIRQRLESMKVCSLLWESSSCTIHSVGDFGKVMLLT